MRAAWRLLLTLAVLFTVATIRGLVVGDLFARGPVVDGVVIGTQRSASARDASNRVTSLYAPVIRIEHPPGQPHELRHATGWSAEVDFAVGDVLPIRVNEQAPALSVRDTFAWVYVVPAVKLLVPVALWALALAVRARLPRADTAPRA